MFAPAVFLAKHAASTSLCSTRAYAVSIKLPLIVTI